MIFALPLLGWSVVVVVFVGLFVCWFVKPDLLVLFGIVLLVVFFALLDTRIRMEYVDSDLYYCHFLFREVQGSLDK